MKKIFERILKLVESLEDNSQTAFAKKIGCQQSTFNGYMNEEGQRKIRLILLEDILKVYPQISREWLYFGGGEIRERTFALSSHIRTRDDPERPDVPTRM